MKSKVFGILLAAMLLVSGCGQRGENEPEKTPIENTQKPVESVDTENTQNSEEREKNITLYYIEESTGEIASKEVSVKGDVSKGIIKQLKADKVLAETCDVKSISVNSAEKKADLAMNKEFGDYIRSMGTTGSEQILECLVRTYLNAYECEGLKITEDGNPLDTGHTVLDGYISYE